MPAGSAGSAGSKTMLNQRIVTALVISALGLAILFTFPAWAFSLFAGIVLLGMGGREAARLSGVDARSGHLAYIALQATLGAAIWFLLMPGQVQWILVPVCIFWLIPFIWLTSAGTGKSTRGGWRILKLCVFLVILPGAWIAASWLQLLDPWLVFLLLVSVATGDIGAFFFGRTIGGAKLAPSISPGKTWAGVLGACLTAPACTALAAWLIPGLPVTPLMGAGIALAVTPIGIGGDLFVSLLKRHADLKDTGTLLPGHGGVLDRLDSICAGLPFFALVIWYLVQ